MRKIYLLLMAISLIGNSYSQGINAIIDGNNKLRLFYNGFVSVKEYQTVTNLKISPNYITYADNNNDYNVLYKGQKIRLTRGNTNIEHTNNYLIYKITSVLRVFEMGKKTILTSYVGSYAFGDSIVVFTDQIGGNLKYFYQDSITEFSQVLNSYNISPNEVGENVFVYQDNSGNYFGFYANKFYELFSSNRTTNFSAGLNVIAFNDQENYTFSVFYKGELFDLEDQHANFYKSGYDFVYYKDNSDVHKVYYNDEIEELGYDLEQLTVYDSIIYFKDSGLSKVWYAGKIYTFFNDQIKSYQVSNGNLVFLSPNGKLKAFIRGEIIEITSQQTQGFLLNGNNILIKYSQSSFSVWWNNKMFNF